MRACASYASTAPREQPQTHRAGWPLTSRSDARTQRSLSGCSPFFFGCVRLAVRLAANPRCVQGLPIYAGQAASLRCERDPPTHPGIAPIRRQCIRLGPPASPHCERDPLTHPGIAPIRRQYIRLGPAESPHCERDPLTHRGGPIRRQCVRLGPAEIPRSTKGRHVRMQRARTC